MEYINLRYEGSCLCDLRLICMLPNVIVLLQLRLVTITHLTADDPIRSLNFSSVWSINVHSPRTTYCRQQHDGSGL